MYRDIGVPPSTGRLGVHCTRIAGDKGGSSRRDTRTLVGGSGYSVDKNKYISYVLRVRQ